MAMSVSVRATMASTRDPKLRDAQARFGNFDWTYEVGTAQKLAQLRRSRALKWGLVSLWGRDP